MRNGPFAALPVALALLMGVSSGTGAQAPEEEAASGSVVPAADSASPFDAYRAGRYDVAVEGFRERAARRPDDPVRQLNLGSALHQASEYAAAESALGRATEARDQRLRAAALYNLGNNAYHQGRLEDAVEHYREALDLQPEDEDTKYNLEFVQQEMERRRQQSQQRQQNPQNQDSQDEQDQDQQNQDQQNQGEQNQDQQDQSPSSGDQQDQQPQDESQQGQSRDSDGDGLSDEQERSAENPTNPNNPDSDGDGRPDGEEDRNRNGRVDEGETNPNVPDQPDTGEQQSQDPQQGESQQKPGQGSPRPTAMSPEEAARLLASLEDRRPPGARGKKVAETTKRSEKDW